MPTQRLVLQLDKARIEMLNLVGCVKKGGLIYGEHAFSERRSDTISRRQCN